MSDDGFNDINGIDDLFRKVCSPQDDKPKEELIVERTRKAIKEYNAEVREKLYSETVESLGNSPDYNSTRHMAFGLFGLLCDASYQNNNALNTVADTLNNLPSISDILSGKYTKRKSETEEQSQEQKEPARNYTEDYIQAVVSYSKGTGKSPEKILRSKEDMAVILTQVYGSIDAYEAIQVDNLKKAFEMAEKVGSFANTPVSSAFSLLESQLGLSDNEALNDLKNLKDAADQAIGVVQGNMNDLSSFSRTFLSTWTKHLYEDIKDYKAKVETKDQ